MKPNALELDPKLEPEPTGLQRPDVLLRYWPGRHFFRQFPDFLLRIIPSLHGGTRQRLDLRLRVCPGFLHGDFLEILFAERLFVERLFVERLFVERLFVEGDFLLAELEPINLQRPDLLRYWPGRHFLRQFPDFLLRIIPSLHGGTRQRLDFWLRV